MQPTTTTTTTARFEPFRVGETVTDTRTTVDGVIVGLGIMSTAKGQRPGIIVRDADGGIRRIVGLRLYDIKRLS